LVNSEFTASWQYDLSAAVAAPFLGAARGEHDYFDRRPSSPSANRRHRAAWRSNPPALSSPMRAITEAEVVPVRSLDVRHRTATRMGIVPAPRRAAAEALSWIEKEYGSIHFIQRRTTYTSASFFI